MSNLTQLYNKSIRIIPEISSHVSPEIALFLKNQDYLRNNFVGSDISV